jgi:hypothetical protein
MKEGTIEASTHDRSHSGVGSPRGRGRRRGMAVALLVGGFHIPGILEYSARGDQVTFTITNVPLSAPGKLDPETAGEVKVQARNRTRSSRA